MERNLTQEEIHEALRKELWCKVYVAYASAANAVKIDGGCEWADVAVKHFDERFKPIIEM